MAPEHEARPRAAFYDHESEEPRRRRRPAADWGVGEDIFDRMPSRRFARAERRAEHHEIVVRRARGEGTGTDEARAGEAPRRPAGRREAVSWGDHATTDEAPGRRGDAVTRDDEVAGPREDPASRGGAAPAHQ